MRINPDRVEELNILALFDLSTTLEGIKVHKTAGPAAIAATERLHAQGLITLKDGGYLTPLGVRAAEHVRALLTLLNPDGQR